MGLMAVFAEEGPKKGVGLEMGISWWVYSRGGGSNPCLPPNGPPLFRTCMVFDLHVRIPVQSGGNIHSLTHHLICYHFWR